MNRFVDWFRNLKYRKKIILICLLVSLIPVIVLGSFSYKQMRELLIAREINVLEESLNQACNTLEYKIDSYFNVMDHIIWNQDLLDSLDKRYDNNYEMYISYRDIIEPLFMTSRSLHKEINDITIYTDNPMNPHGNMVRPLSDICDLPCFDNSLSTTLPQLTVSKSDNQLNIMRQLYGFYLEYTHIISLNIDYDHTFDSLSSLFDESYGIIILDENKDLIYEFHNFPDTKANYALTKNSLVEKLNKDILANDYVFDSRILEASNWTSYLYRPIQVVSGPANKITLIVFTIIICCIIIILFVSYYLSSVLVRPLERLSNNMQQIESGDLTITVTDNSKDEIGHLIRSFGQMVNQLKYLIDEVYKGKITQQEYEMKALQSQINPHFFYNSLSLINSKAIMAGEEDISQMTQFLSTFYRTTLNKGKSIISIEDEWTNVVSYIHIQRMMHSNSFDAYYEIDENILNYTMPNLVLQPLVENAIEHGLDHKLTSGRAILNISGKQSDGNIVFLVSDNGPGMEAGLLENILNEETSGYGVQNVHRRIQLYYGENYGLSYDSSPDKGTRVTLTIPKQ